MVRTPYLEIAVFVIALLLTVLCLWALTVPRIATPLAERAGSFATGREVAIEEAYMRYRGGPVFRMRGLEIPERVDMARLDLHPNLFGLLPGVALLKRAEGENGAIVIAYTGASKSNDYEDYIDEIALSDIGVTIERETATSRFRIVEASGSLRGGDLSIDAVAGDGQVFFRGDGSLSELHSIVGAVTVQGPNLANVADALGIAAPDVPPFKLNGRLAIEQERWVMRGLSGNIGNTDIGGDLTVDFSTDKPRIIADIASNALDFDDLGVIVGLPSQNEDGAALNEAQQAANTQYEQSGRFIPDAAIDFSRLSSINADVAYSADSVADAPFGVSQLGVDIELQNSVLTINSVTAAMAEGQLALSGTLDATQTPAQTQLSATLNDLHLERIVPQDNARGLLEGRAELALTGNDFRTAFAGADGTITFWAENADVAAVPVEAADLDLGEILMVMGGDDDGSPVYVAAPCMVMRLEVKDGIGRTRPFVVDTEDSVIIADGTVGFREETLDLALSADAKDLSWGRLLGNVSIGGHWRDPSVSVAAGGTAVQAVFAGLLGTLAAPLAGLPFLEAGDAEDVPCQSLLARARGQSVG